MPGAQSRRAHESVLETLAIVRRHLAWLRRMMGEDMDRPEILGQIRSIRRKLWMAQAVLFEQRLRDGIGAAHHLSNGTREDIKAEINAMIDACRTRSR